MIKCWKQRLNMDKSGKMQNRPQCIVLPFQPDAVNDYNGVGLALHFLMGNVMVLNNRLKECWFGWRVNKIFTEKTDMQAYCRGKEVLGDLHQHSTAQNVRFWLYGTIGLRYATVCLFDAAHNEYSPLKEIPVSCSDGLVECRRVFLDYLKACGHPFPAEQVQPALWVETISIQGMDILGRALESFYLHSAYSEKGSIDLGLFERAVAVAPHSFMVQDLLGWAYYRKQDYSDAKASFLRALRSNPYGIGAMSGLMWCGMYTGDVEEAQFWAARKAEVRREDIKKARQKALKRMKSLK